MQTEAVWRALPRKIREVLAESIGKLLYRRNYYFVPFKQDNPITKPRSIVADFNMIIKTIEFALEGEQISPII